PACWPGWRPAWAAPGSSTIWSSTIPDMLSDRHWREIRGHAERLRGHSLQALAAAHGRARAMSLTVGPIHASFARQRIDERAWSALLAMAAEAGLEAALHMALRGGAGHSPAADAAAAAATAARAKMETLAAGLADSAVTDVVHVGIGGSALGPRLAVDALREFADQRLRVHFLSNAEGGAASRLLARLDPARTAGILVSKSFGTRETLVN